LDEREAIRQLRAGDVDALEPLVRAHQLRAMRTAYLITRDRQMAEDIVQDAFLRAYEGIAQLKPDNPFGPWFLRIVANDALKAAARGRRWTPLPEDSEALEAMRAAADATPGPDEVILGTNPEMRSGRLLASFLPNSARSSCCATSWAGERRRWRSGTARRSAQSSGGCMRRAASYAIV
jgi:RNA polymerase sigma factor (sigma-70 family)